MKRLHPRSAVVRVGRAALQGAFFGFFAASIGAGTSLLPTLALPVLATLGTVIGGGYALARYLRFRYELSGDTLTVESGVFARQSRQIPVGRIQNIDVKQNVLNRILGLAVVSFETAGGSATEARLDAVDTAEVDRLRRLLQNHEQEARRRKQRGEEEEVEEGEAVSSGQHPSPSGADRGTDAKAGAANAAHAGSADGLRDQFAIGDAERVESLGDGDLLFAFDVTDLLTYAVVSIRPAAPVLTLAGLPLGMDLVMAVLRFNAGVVGADGPIGLWLIRRLATPRLALLALLTAVQFVLLALLVSVALTVVEYYGFKLTQQGDDLRYERGLLRRYSGTIPLSKVQSLTIRENVLMRRFGFATLVVETAGYSGGDRQSTQGVAVPLASRAAVYELARDIELFGDLSFDRPPRRARRRYVARFSLAVGALTAVAYALDTAILEFGYWWAVALLFLGVVPAAHLRWRHRGFDPQESALATRSGFWRQTTRIVPYYRLQTVFVTRTLFQRRRDLATVGADTASTSSILGGVATVYDVDEETASHLRDTLRERLTAHVAARRAASETATASGFQSPREAESAAADDEEPMDESDSETADDADE